MGSKRPRSPRRGRPAQPEDVRPASKSTEDASTQEFVRNMVDFTENVQLPLAKAGSLVAIFFAAIIGYQLMEVCTREAAIAYGILVFVVPVAFAAMVVLLPGSSDVELYLLKSQAPYLLTTSFAVIADTIGMYAYEFKYYGLQHESSPALHDPLISLYFSAITWTTVGYGDYTPANGMGRLFAASEALTAYFVMALVIATLITLFGSNKR